MAYSTPHPWELDTVPSHSVFDQDLIASPLSMRSLFDASVRVIRSPNQSIPDDNRTEISWSSTLWQTGSLWSGGSPTRLTAPVAGIYLFTMKVPWAPNSTGRRGIGYMLASVGLEYNLQFMSAASDDPRQNGADLIKMEAADYIEVQAYQDSGGALNVLGGSQALCSATLTLRATETEAPPWTLPRDWANDDLGTAWRFNDQFRDKILNRRYFNAAAVSLYLTENQSVASGQRTGIPWDAENFQVGGMWTSGADILAPVAGWYGLLATVEWTEEASAATGANRGIGYRINGRSPNYDLQFQGGVTAGQSCNGKALVRLEQGDKLQVYAYHDAEQSLNISDRQDRTRVSMWLEAAA